MPLVASASNPNLGILLAELLNLIGVENCSQYIGAVPLHIANAPLNVLALQDYLSPQLTVLPAEYPVSLSLFAQLVAQFLAEDLSYNIIAIIEGLPIL